MPHSSRGALTPGLFWHQPGALATRSPRVLAKDTKDCFWPHTPGVEHYVLDTSLDEVYFALQ